MVRVGKMSLEIVIPKKIYVVTKLTAAEREKAMLVSPHTYPQDMPCMVCHCRWRQHKGALCVSRPGYFSHESGRPVPPTFGDTAFVPDENWANPNPDFAVV